MEFNYMKQQDWIDFFQAVHGRNPSIQEMAEAANRGEFVWETPKQTVEATKKLSQKETVEKTQNSETVEHIEPEPSAETVETVKMMLTIMMSLKNPWMILVSMKDKLSKLLT